MHPRTHGGNGLKRLLLQTFSTTPSTKQPSVVILGAPGSGKGTISSKLVDDFAIIHISTGDLLRDAIAHGTALGQAAAEVMKKGGLVPDNLVFQLVETELAMHPAAAGHHVLFDGFPRTVAQAREIHRRFQVDAVVSLAVPHQTVIDRISSRWVHLASGRTYSSDYHPEKRKGFDDETGEPLVQREDDKPASVLRRLQLYEQMRTPLLAFFQHDTEGRALVGNFEGTKTDEIYPLVHKFLRSEVGLRPQ